MVGVGEASQELACLALAAQLRRVGWRWVASSTLLHPPPPEPPAALLQRSCSLGSLGADA